MIEFKYRPDVDGLRAVAVSMVLLFHAGLGFPGGFVGVDVFFVISGFLITGLILKQQAAGEFSLSNFWLRRIRRIIPAATVMVVVVLGAGFLLMTPTDYAEVGESAIAQQLMLANVYFWQHTGYFDGPSDLKPLLHCWSLGVEEQFYIGYPFLLLLLARIRKLACVLILIFIGCVSLAASQYGVEHHPSATFYLLPTRAWELLIGGLVCFAPPPNRLRDWQLTIVSWISLIGILGTGLLFAANTPFPGLTALAPCGFTATLIYANSIQLTAPARLLAAKPVVFVGLISYSLYLWHWPVLAFLRYRLGENIAIYTAFFALAVSFLLGWLSWRWIETPFRRVAWLKSSRQLVTVAVICSLTLCATGLIVSRDGVRSRYPQSFLDAIDVPYAGLGFGATGNAHEGWVLGQLGDESAPARFLLWGDSQAKCTSSLIGDLARHQGISGYDAGRGGTPPLLGAWTGTQTGPVVVEYNQFVMDFAERNDIEWLVLVAAWDIHADGMSKLRDKIGDDPFTVMKRSFTQTLEHAEQHGIKVAVVLESPYQWQHVPTVVARDMVNNSRDVSYGVTRSQHQSFSDQTTEFFESFDQRICLIDASEYYFDGERSVIARNGQPYYSDTSHLSREGVQAFLQEPLTELFTKIAAGATDCPPGDKAEALSR